MSKRDNKILINDIKEEIDRIENFTKSIKSFEEFKQNELVYYAILKCLENIGEAVKNIQDDFKNRYNYIDWKKIAGLRDIISHEYFGVEIKIIWDLIKYKIPEFKKEILKILENFNSL
ncbi:MAG: DUF86 domain-containing protein [Caldisericia bacterium]